MIKIADSDPVMVEYPRDGADMIEVRKDKHSDWHHWCVVIDEGLTCEGQNADATRAEKHARVAYAAFDAERAREEFEVVCMHCNLVITLQPNGAWVSQASGVVCPEHEGDEHEPVELYDEDYCAGCGVAFEEHEDHYHKHCG